MAINMSIEDGGDGVEAVFDALHGDIDLSDVCETDGPQIRKIVSSPFVQRLRRIKQLGFVSQNFLSAQHNRYSHALGTLQMMRKLLDQLDRTSLFEHAIPEVRHLTDDKSFVDKNSGKNRSINRIKQHLLVSALIQDVGELPYEKATGRIFSPGKMIKRMVGNCGVDVNQLQDNKILFTLHFLWNLEYSDYFVGLDKNLLTYLISGHSRADFQAGPSLKALRQMLDGAIDADRLDYVHRDALHTLGVHHRPDALIKSIEKYDDRGPILRHVRPVTDFMITRAMLWSSVYLSPENRFRIILLRTALRELCGSSEGVDDFIGWHPDETTPEKFLNLHDLFIENVIRRLDEEKPDLEEGNAIRLLQRGAQEYEYRWVRFGDERHQNYEFKGPPSGFYWDTYADYTERIHTLYDRQTIRIEGDRYSRLKGPTYLEECMGPFCGMLKHGSWPALPMPNHMAWFARRSDWDSKEGLWGPLFKFEKTRQLALELEVNDPLKGVETVFDTSSNEHFRRPEIFVAFAWEDRDVVKRALAILFEQKRRYFVFRGGSAVANTEADVDQAEAVLLFVSAAYVEAHSNEKDPIFDEVRRLKGQRDKIPVFPVRLDDIHKPGFPWDELTREEWRGSKEPPLRYASSAEFRRRIENALAEIDRVVQQAGQ